MIINAEFTPAQSSIIKDVCNLRMESIQRIYKCSDEDLDLILLNFGLTKQDFHEESANILMTMEELAENPRKLFNLNHYDMSMFRHILYTFRERWEDKKPNAFSNLWNKIHQSDSFERVYKPN